MIKGLLDGLNDPEVIARIGERRRIAERIAEQMGCTIIEARWRLDNFIECNSSEGHELN